MKRITKDVKRLDFIASLIDIVYVLIVGFLLARFFTVLETPSNITQTVNVNYTILGLFTWDSGELNFAISLAIGYLLVFVPMAFTHIKRLRSKDLIEMDPWTYRTQFLYAGFSLITLNIGSAVVRFLAGREIHRIVEERTMTDELKRAGTWVKELFDGTIRERRMAARAARLQLAQTQLDVEELSRRDLISRIIGMVANYTLLTFIALFIFIPFYWMMLTALKTYGELENAIQPRVIIGLSEMQWVNFKVALIRFNFWSYLRNTFMVGILSMIGTVTTTILAAFAFSRLDFKGREFIFSLLLMTMMIPGELYTITNFITVRNLNWYNTYFALIFPFMTSVFYIFFLRQSFKQIPDTLYRAAQVDGCGDFKYLTRIMIPIAKPTITTITILSAIGAWDAYIWPQLVAPRQDMWLISVALRSTSFTIGTGSDARPVYNLQLAATALVTVPLLIIFFSLKKYIIAGVGRSGTKG
jgi:ABC-type glycerol-3-phosphate transport system permease component